MKILCLTFLLFCAFFAAVRAEETSAPENNVVYVLGAVGKPSEIRLDEGIPLKRAIARVGGFSKKKGKFVNIYRRISGTTKREVIKINLKDLQKGAAADLILKPLDIIEVAPRKKRGDSGGVFLDIKTSPVRY